MLADGYVVELYFLIGLSVSYCCFLALDSDFFFLIYIIDSEICCLWVVVPYQFNLCAVQTPAHQNLYFCGHCFRKLFFLILLW